MSSDRSILKHFFTFSGLTMVSRVLGFIRDTLITHYLGKTVWYELFLIAYKTTNWVRRFFAEGAMNVSLVPELVNRKNSPQDFQRLAQNTFSLVLFALSFFVIIMEVLAPTLIPLLVTKYQGEQLTHLILLVRLNFPYALFISLCAVCGAVLNTHQKFYAESSLPVILNMSIIGAVLLFRNADGPGMTKGISAGVLVAGIVQFFWMYWLCCKQHFAFHIERPLWHSEETAIVVKRTTRNSLVSFANQINLFVDLYLATLLPTGAIVFLHTADRINQFPLSIIGVALSVVLLPNFSAYTQDHPKARALFQNAFLGALQIAIPLTFLLILLADPIFYVLYYHGKFTLLDSLETARTLKAYAFGIPFVILSKILLSFLFANNISRVPLIAAIVSVILNIVISLTTIYHIGHIGIALATSTAAIVNFVILFCYAAVLFPYLLSQFKGIFKLIGWSVVTGIGFYLLKTHLFLNIYDSRLANFMLLVMLTGAFLLLYWGVGYRMGCIVIPEKSPKK